MPRMNIEPRGLIRKRIREKREKSLEKKREKYAAACSRKAVCRG